MKKSLSFYIEILSLLVVLLLCSTLLVSMYGSSKKMTVEASDLTVCIRIAENEIESYSTSSVKETEEIHYYDSQGNETEKEDCYTSYSTVTENTDHPGLYDIETVVKKGDTEIYTLNSSKYVLQ